MADFFSNSSENFDLGSSSVGGTDKLKADEIQKVIMMEQQKAQLNAQVKYLFKRFVLFIYIIS
jgi:hypothetical protein